MSHKPKKRTFSQRLETITEIENKINNLNISNLPAMKVLQLIMDKYLKDGTPCDTLLNLSMGDRNRVIIVKLYNDSAKKDLVLIKAKEDLSEQDQD
jgi:hypothetical protein